MCREVFLSRALFALLLVTAVWVKGDEPGKGSLPEQPAAEVFVQPAFEVPEGFTVELAAGPPLVKHPIMAGFDEKGRLYVAENAGLNLPRVDLEKQLPNGILRLEDSDGDGKFDKRTVFADKMTFPQGALWHAGSLYVASSGGIWKLTDLNDDGVADERELLVSKFGYTGNAADVHGCFLGPDGRIYWCEGRHGHEIADKAGTLLSKGKAARIFSCKTDGSDMQVHCGGGMDNPVEIDWTEEGEMLGTVNIFYHRRGDCLVHWMHGGVYPRLDQPEMLAEFPRTGEPLDAVHDFGHVAVSGCMRYRSGGLGFGESYANNWFVTQFNTHKVVRCVLERDGSTFKATEHEFLKAKSDDFHPTDVLEDADGSLLVVDTGGWFRIGCPTSQIAKPNILGGIYRVRRTDAKKVEDARGLAIDWKKLTWREKVALLDEPRFAVRTRAIEEISMNRNDQLEIFKGGFQIPKSSQLELVWAFARAQNQAANIFYYPKNDHSARLASLYCKGTLNQLRVDKQTGKAPTFTIYDSQKWSYTVLKQLAVDGDSPELRRSAATALGQIGNPNAIPDLLLCLTKSNDRVLEHALIYALIEIGDRGETAKGLAHEHPSVRRGALIALDQMQEGNLTRDEVVALLDTEDGPLQTAAMEIITRRKWTQETIAFVGKLLEQAELTESQQGMASRSLVALLHEKEVQTLLATALAKASLPPGRQKLLLDVLAQGDLATLPPELDAAIKASLTSPDAAVLHAGVQAAKGEAFDELLLAIARDSARPAETRLTAYATIAAHKQPVSDTDISFLTNLVTQGETPLTRVTAAGALGSATLTGEQLKTVAALVAEVGPLEISPLLGAFSSSRDDAVGRELAAALAKSPGAGSLTFTQLETLLAPYSATARGPAQALIERLTIAAKDQRQRVDEFAANLTDGNPQVGRDIFTSKRAACAACHRVGTDGGSIGPDLTKVGERRNQRDLLEAVLYPSASIGQGFETYNLRLENGLVHSGLITRQTTEAVYLRTTDQRDIRLRRGEIEEMSRGNVSVMPAGLENTMTREQLRDLIAYLRSLR